MLPPAPPLRGGGLTLALAANLRPCSLKGRPVCPGPHPEFHCWQDPGWKAADATSLPPTWG